MSSFHDRLKHLRKEKDLTQEELAKKLGISRSSLAMYEQGNREPDLETQELIADFFNVNLDYLMGRSKNRTTIFLQSDVDMETFEAIYKSSLEEYYLTRKYEETDIEPDDIFILSTEEEKMISKFRELSDKGKEMVLSYLDFLTESERK